MSTLIERLREQAAAFEAGVDAEDGAPHGIQDLYTEAADAMEALSNFVNGWIEHSNSRIIHDGSPFDKRQAARKEAFEQVAEYLRLHGIQKVDGSQ